MRLLPGEALARHSTFHAGGPADVLLVESGAELEALAAAGGLPPVALVMGGGSNLLVADAGVAGTVLVLRAPHGVPAEVPQPDTDGLVWLDGAWDWPAVALATAQRGDQGLESMVGIPGTVGGAVVQGIGAYGSELRERFVAATAVDLATGAVLDLDAGAVGFRYRHTELKGQEPPRLVVTRAAVRLTPGGRHQPKYSELAATLEESARGEDGGYRPADVAAAVLGLRRSKSMIYDEADAQTWGAGSFFKNPECDEQGFARLVDRLAVDPVAVPHWPKGGAIRLSAGWLVERSGFRRGHRAGAVGLCDRHALGIANLSGVATAAEILHFAATIRNAVYEHTGIGLEPEPVLVGVALPPLAG